MDALESKMPIINSETLLPKYLDFLKGAIKNNEEEMENLKERIATLGTNTGPDDVHGLTRPPENRDTKSDSINTLDQTQHSISAKPFDKGKTDGHQIQSSAQGNTYEQPIKKFHQIKMLELVKPQDSGAFAITCTIKHSTFPNCICDTGAAMSVMPLTIAENLGLNKYKSSTHSVLMADGSTREPYGIIEDVPIRIDGILLPTDFLIFDMDTRSNTLLLGRPFLAKTQAKMRMDTRTIELNLGGSRRATFTGNNKRFSHQLPNQRETRAEQEHLPNIILEPIKNGADIREYRVICGRKPTIQESLPRLQAPRPQAHKTLGPYSITGIQPCGRVMMHSYDDIRTPFLGQKVMIYLTESEEGTPSLAHSTF